MHFEIMLFLIIIYYLLASFLVVDVLFHLLQHAPLGWEDERGFHFGQPKINKRLFIPKS